MKIQFNKNFNIPYRKLLHSLIGAIVFLIVYEAWINDFIAMPLRVVSTSISEVVVSLFGYDVIREGTSLVVGSFRFNVDVACSGSKTMQEMIATAIVLVGIWSNLSLVQRALAVVIAVPIAVFTNGLRVSGLMLASLKVGSGITEETFLHQFIGVLAFALALFIFWQSCKLIAQVSVFNKFELIVKYTINILLIIIIFFPFIYESFYSWKGSEWNPYNRYAWVFLLLSFLILVIEIYSEKLGILHRLYKGEINFWGVGLTICGLGWGIVVTKLGFVSIQGFGFLVFISGVLVLNYTIKALVYVFPILILMTLSFPRMPLLINEISGSSGYYNWGYIFAIRWIISVILIATYLFIRKSAVIKKFILRDSNAIGAAETKAPPKTVSKMFLNVILLLSVGGSLLWQGYIDNNKFTQKIDYSMLELFPKLPLNMGIWDSQKVEISEKTKELLGGTHAVLRVYSSEYALPVEFFYNFSGGNRHSLHPPEYCLTGAGWKILSKKSLNLGVLNKQDFPITVMKLHNDGEIRWFAFWFYNGINVEANYVKMLGEDLFSRLSGQVREWSIYRVIAYREKDLLKFINELSLKRKN